MTTTRPGPLVFAHRGWSDRYPENTLPALRAGLDLGVDGCECDVHRTRDGVPFLLHDAGFGRTGDREDAAADLAWETVAGIDVGRWKGEAFAGLTPPRLTDALRLHRERGATLVVELKADDTPDALAEAVLGAVAEADAARHWVAFSFGLAYLAALRERDPRVPLLWLLGRLPETLSERDDLLAQAADVGLSGLAPVWTALRPGFVRRAHRRTLAVWTWTVNTDEAVRHAVSAGADALVTDRPDYVADALLR